MTSVEPNTSKTEHHDENTLFRVYDALREEVSLTEKQARAAISAMQKRGILFRERRDAVAKTATPTNSVPVDWPRADAVDPRETHADTTDAL